MRKIISMIIFIFYLSCFVLLFSEDNTGNILFYSDLTDVYDFNMRNEIIGAMTFKYFYSDKECFDISSGTKFKVFKKIEPGTYNIVRLEIINRSQNTRSEYDNLNISVKVEKNKTTVFPVKLITRTAVGGYKIRTTQLLASDYDICNNYIIKKKLSPMKSDEEFDRNVLEKEIWLSVRGDYKSDLQSFSDIEFILFSDGTVKGFWDSTYGKSATTLYGTYKVKGKDISIKCSGISKVNSKDEFKVMLLAEGIYDGYNMQGFYNFLFENSNYPNDTGTWKVYIQK